MIGMMERTAAVLSFEQLPEGKATVGFEVCVKHVAAAAEGATCTVARAPARGRRRPQAPLRRRGPRGRAHDRRRHPRAPRDRRRPARLAATTLVDVSAYPTSVRIREVGPRDGFQNEPEVIPTAEKVRLIGMLADCGLGADRGDLVRPRRRDPAARRRRGGARGDRAPRRRRLLGPDPERARARARARAPRPLRRGQRLPLRLRDPQPQERQPLDRGVARGARAHARGGAGRGPALRGRDLGLVRLPLRGRGAARARVRDRRAARRGRLRGGRLRRHDRDGQPAPGRRASSPRRASA